MVGSVAWERVKRQQKLEYTTSAVQGAADGHQALVGLVLVAVARRLSGPVLPLSVVCNTVRVWEQVRWCRVVFGNCSRRQTWLVESLQSFSELP